jgi:hypothetical protein
VEALGDRYVDASLSRECSEGECSEFETSGQPGKETVCS